ncbi:MAG: hypothetical protein ACXWM6_12305 [Thermodesulfobacteriota bacterium]
MLLATAVAAPVKAVELNQAALKGFNRYAELTEQRIHDQARHGQFLWVDALHASERDEFYARLGNGEVVERKLETKDKGRTIETPQGMIHDWVSLVFVPGATLVGVKALFQDYDNHYRYYGPEVERSKLLSRKGDDFKIYLRMRKKKIVTVVLNANFDAHYNQLDASHLMVSSYSTRIAEVEAPGTPEEHELPVGNDSGFMWRSNSYWWAEEKDGGVYVQCETLTLTRNIPFGLRWLTEFFLDSTTREFLNKMMVDMRKGVERMQRSNTKVQSMERATGIEPATSGFGSLPVFTGFVPR